MARRVRLVRRNQGSAGELPYDEWIPAHAVKFNTDGTTSLMTESEHAHNRGRRRNPPNQKYRGWEIEPNVYGWFNVPGINLWSSPTIESAKRAIDVYEDARRR